ncbi:MAG: tetratricopeptide repeat protein [candidate division WOR-3 bacterium]
MKRGIKSEDSFQQFVERVIKYIVRHKETSIWLGIGIIGGIVFLVYFLTNTEADSPEADLLHTQAISMLSMGRVQEAENVFRELTEKYLGTRPGKIALYYLGIINYHTGRFAEALDYFNRFLGKVSNDHLLTPSAYFGAGCAAEGLKDYERAMKYYEKIARNKDSPFYFWGMLAWGRLTGLCGNPQKAIEILEELIKQNPPYDVISDAKYYIGYFNR